MAVAGVSTGDGSGSVSDPSSDDYYEDFTVTGWTGYIGFAALMLILIGCFHAVAGFVGIFKDSVYAVPSKDLLVSVDYTAWGWVHLIFGLLAILVAVGMFAGSMWARVVAVILAVVSALGNLAFFDAKPIWATIIIAFDVLLIWALTVHGGEMKNR
jgi:hypothetical protein